MATEYITADSFGEDIQIERNFNDANLVIDTGVLVGSANNDAVVLSASFHDVLLRGTVSGYGSGIIFGAPAATQQGNVLRIAGDGLLQGEVNGATFWGDARLDNLGTVWAGVTGVQANLSEAQAFRLVNDGTIAGGREGVWIVGGATTRVHLLNTGTIEGGDFSYRGLGSADTLVNRGTLRGDVLLHDGDDRYDGRGGAVEGSIVGGLGTDTFLPGLGEETIDGGGDFDTLDFRSGGALRVSLADDSGTGRAEGDRYWEIERVLGSASGDDTLIGHHGHETLEGLGGADRLVGGEGRDTLRGGAEADRLTGGWGNDAFAFSRPEEGGDVITDWSSVAGNNDRLVISASRFYLPSFEDTLDPELFVTRASDNLAQEGDDRFVFRLSDRTLWYDGNGKAAGALILLADLQDGAVVTAADFEVV